MLKGESSEECEDSDALVRSDPGHAGLLAASISGRTANGPRAGQKTVREGDPVDAETLQESASRCATADGFSLHADVAVPARDRERLERLCRNAERPPLAVERLRRLADGRIAYEFKRPWRDGTTRIIFEPVELIERLAALVPRPRGHLVRYSGVLGPAARWRPAVVPHNHKTSVIAEPCDPHETGSGASEHAGLRCLPRNYSWAQLMRRVFSQDVLACGRCGGRLEMIADPSPGKYREDSGVPGPSFSRTSHRSSRPGRFVIRLRSRLTAAHSRFRPSSARPPLVFSVPPEERRPDRLKAPM